MKRIIAPCVLAILLCVVGAPAATVVVKPATKVSQDLQQLHAEHAAAVAAGASFQATNALIPVAGGRVTINAIAAGDTAALEAALRALGAQGIASAGRIVSAQLPIAAIPALDGLASLNFARPAYAVTSLGAVTSQGDAAMRAGVARSTFGVNGAGVTVGVLSDSFGCLPGGVAADVATGDLPAGVNVLQELSGCAGGTDEGRAMVQIVHDVAPGAGLAFATGLGGQAVLANNIQALASAGARVIVDDVIYFDEPMFQDGIVAQTVDAVAAGGVTYFSAAGDSGRRAYESAFRPGTMFAPDDFVPDAPGFEFLGGTAHDFDPGPAIDSFQSVTIPTDGSFILALQWDSPFASVSGPPGTQNDVDVYLLNATNTVVAARSVDGNIGFDAFELIDLTNHTGSPLTLNVLIVRYAGNFPGRIKYVLFRPATIDEHATDSGTLYGHANALGAIAVGAAFYGDTPAFGTNPPVLEPFSSAGTTPILFTTAGAPTFDARAGKPEIGAPDGGDNTFFGSDADATGFPNFFGTSAAAPHAAGVAALLIDSVPGLAPGQIRATLQATALDMGVPGFDNDSGAGLVQADAALASPVLPAVPVLGLQLNQAVFHPGDTMVLTATLTPGLVAPLVDAYIAVQLPGGSLFSLQPVGAVPGIAPVATGFVPIPFVGVVVIYQFTGAEPFGPWSWFAALTQTGTVNLVGGFQQLTFTVSP
ncbi:MAG: S8 family peptidase [Candidatus Rokuibacteriota bacterium]